MSTMRSHRKHLFVLFAIVFSITLTQAQRGARVGYIDINVILENVE
jgi:glycopeptide antibiotics resistance protein